MKTKRPLAEAQAIAEDILYLLTPACERIAIAGSIRRQCDTVGDVEIVAIPKPVLDLLGEPTAETQLDWILRDAQVSLSKNGPRYKQFTVTTNGVEAQVDLFLCRNDNWGYILMLRTGPAEFSRRMVTGQDRGGLRPPEYEVMDGRVWRPLRWDGDIWTNSDLVLVSSEEELFRLWGMEYVRPEDR